MNRVEKIVIRKYAFASPDVPPGFEGTTIAFLSDIHHSATFPVEQVRSLVDMANAQRPDLILLGGDYVTNETACIRSFFTEAARFTAPLGVYGVLGNHDIWTDRALTERCMREAGITLLDNYGLWLERGGSRIRLGGIGDLKTSRQDLGPMLAGTRPDDLMILVTHHPDYALRLPKDLIDLMLCGHTHGGQVSFFGKWIPPWPGGAHRKDRSGVVGEGRTTVIISNGIGTVGPPVRIFAAPQIWLITLSRKGRASSSGA